MTVNHKARVILFWTLVILFVLGGSGTVLYSQGWRLDLTSLTPKKVGAIFVRSFPKEAEIYLDGKRINNDSWLLFSGTLINNLFPKTYELVLRLEKYRTWKQRLTVEPMKVTEAKYAVLIPLEDSAVATTVPPGSTNFRLLPNASFLWQTDSALFLNSTKINGAELKFLLPGNDNAIVATLADNYYLNRLSSGTSTASIMPAIKAAKLTGVPRFFGADSPSKVLVTTADTVALLDVFTNKVDAIATTSVKTYGRLLPDTAAGNRKYAAFAVKPASSTGSVVHIMDISSSQILPDRAPAFKNNIKKLEWMADGRLAVLEDDGNLSIYSPTTNKSEMLASEVKDFVFLGDASRVAILEKYAVEIISFLPEYKERDYRRFALKNNMNITRLVWYKDEQHLLVGYPDGVFLLDLNDRNLDYYEKLTDASLWQYDSGANILYFLFGKELRKLEFPK